MARSNSPKHNSTASCCCHRFHYPDPEEEKEILRRNIRLGVRREDRGAVARSEFDVLAQEPVGSSEDLVRAMEAVHEIHVSETFIDHVISLVNRTREHPAVELGCSPHLPGIALIKATLRLSSVIHGRGYVIPEDLYALAEDSLLHRMRLTYEALAEGFTGADLIKSLLHEFGAPNGRPRSPVNPLAR